MQLVEIDTQQAYEQIREMIITLELMPGSRVDEQGLAEQLNFGRIPIREALKLLVHDNLIEVSKHRGVYISRIDPEDLKSLSEVRVLMEGSTARLAAQRATEDDILIMETLIEEQKSIPPGDKQAWFEIDHKLHQAISAASQNHYLRDSLEYYFGLSQRLWYLALPKIDFLSQAVQEHADLVRSIKDHKSDEAEEIMAAHVLNFYNKVQEIIGSED
jgi:DNA-binding GntR family transcriptional regulator